MKMENGKLKIMIKLTKDIKSQTYLITRTDNEGFHRQLNITGAEMVDLNKQIMLALEDVTE